MPVNYPESLSFVLIPGWSMPATTLAPLAASLSKDWPVTLIQWPTELEVWQQKESLINALASQLPGGPVILIGWSLGGQLATLLADLLLPPNSLPLGENNTALSQRERGHQREQKRDQASSFSPLLGEKVRMRGNVKGLITLASNPCFVSKENWPYGMAAETFNTFQQGLNHLPVKTLKEFSILVAKGSTNIRATIKGLQQLQVQNGLSHEVLAEGLMLLANLDTRAHLQKLDCPQLHLLAKRDALVNSQLIDWFTQQDISVSCCSEQGHYLVNEVGAVVSHIKRFTEECQ